jgi:phosphoribosylformylglycinamidine cyclo-ligase
LVLGLASSGVHSNGYSLVRRIVAATSLTWDSPAPFDTRRSLGEAMLAPTRIYVKSCLAALRQASGVKAFAHITGGGFTENIPRALPNGLGVQIDLAAVPVLPVFKWLAQAGNVSEPEMLRTFNCGIGMVVIVDAAQAEDVSAVLGRAGETVVSLGTVVPSAAGASRVRYRGHLALS